MGANAVVEQRVTINLKGLYIDGAKIQTVAIIEILPEHQYFGAKIQRVAFTPILLTQSLYILARKFILLRFSLCRICSLLFGEVPLT